MELLKQLVATLVFLGVLVFVHELGHFLFAKWLNVKVLKFAIGFGPKVFGFQRGETEYLIGWIPLGGYVKMAGEQDEDELKPHEAQRGFMAQPPWKRGLIVLAGPAFNLIFPVLAYTFLVWGVRPEISNRIGSVEAGFPAAQAQLLPGDRILKVNEHEVTTFDDIQERLKNTYEKSTTLLIDRNGKQFSQDLIPRRTFDANPVEPSYRGKIGISPVSRSPVLGVPQGSFAEQVGFKTFDVVVSIAGRPTPDERALYNALAQVTGTVEVKVSRLKSLDVPGGAQLPEVVTLWVVLRDQAGYAALGAEAADLYVYSLEPQGPLAEAGLQPGDRIWAVDGHELPPSWAYLQTVLSERKKQLFELSWRHGNDIKSAHVRFREVVKRNVINMKQKSYSLGFKDGFPLASASAPEWVQIHRNFPQAVIYASKETVHDIVATAMGFWRLVTNQLPSESIGSVGTLFKLASATAEMGLTPFVQSMAKVSISLGLVNLVPIPILDGFHLLAVAWESIRRRPIPVRAREIANMVGLALLLLLMVFAMTNDIRNW